MVKARLVKGGGPLPEIHMAPPLDWQADPIVLIETDLIPLLTDVPLVLCFRSLGRPNVELEEALPGRITCFAQSLRSGFSDLLSPTGFQLDADARMSCVEASDAWSALVQALSTDQTEVALTHFQTLCAPRSLSALNEVRRVFIGGVLLRQAAHAELSGAMMSELSRLSRSIQFVAVNASIEAARHGPQGRAFALIAEEIRDLARQAGHVVETQPVS